MHFEHIVIINDPLQPLMLSLSRQQVWSGLLHRVEDARPFLPGLDECTVLSRTGNVFERRLRFNQTVITDRVTLVDQVSVQFDTAPSEAHGGGRLTIAIEEHGEGSLALRFTYESAFATGHEVEDSAYADFLKQAYEAADIDTVAVIRLLAASADSAH
jgi:hypothetical protein